MIFLLKVGLVTVKSNFKPNLISQLGEGGQAKVFKGKFHGKDAWTKSKMDINMTGRVMNVTKYIGRKSSKNWKR